MRCSDENVKDQKPTEAQTEKCRAGEISEESKRSIGNWARDHWYSIPAKNLDTLYSCPENLIKADIKSNRLIKIIL